MSKTRLIDIGVWYHNNSDDNIKFTKNYCIDKYDMCRKKHNIETCIYTSERCLKMIKKPVKILDTIQFIL